MPKAEDRPVLKSVVSAEVSPSMKKDYDEYRRRKGFASVAEAIRYHIRNVTEIQGVSQG